MRKIYEKIGFAMILVVFGLAACKPAEQNVQFPPITFSNENPIKILASRIDVVQEYRPPMAKPNIEYLLPTSPATLAQNWASERLMVVSDRDASQGRVAKFVVRRASAIEVQLPKTEGVKSLFTIDQDKRYDIELSIEFILYDGNGGVLASALNNFKRSFTTAENITESERRTLWFEKIRDLATEMNPALDANIRSKFTPFLTY